MTAATGPDRRGRGPAVDGAGSGAGLPAEPTGRRVLWAPAELPELAPDVAHDIPRYREWMRHRELDRLATGAGAGPPGRLPDPGSHRPRPSAGPDGTLEIALLVVLDRPEVRGIERLLASVATQTVASWRLSVATLGPIDAGVGQSLDRALASMPPGRSEIHARPADEPVALAMASLLEGTSSPAVCVLGQHDQLAPDAVALLGAALTGADVVYADEDWLDGDGSVSHPRLKPDWSPELCLSSPYVGRPAALRRAKVVEAGGIRTVPEGDWEHDLVLRVAEHAARIAHVAEVLCHRSDGGPCPASPGPGAVLAALDRRGQEASVDDGPFPGAWRIRRRLARPPSVTAMIPFRDAPALLRTCVESVIATADGVDLDLVLVDNGSVEPETRTLLDRLGQRPEVSILRDPRPFNWAALNNAAARCARGDVLVFLNNDIEALHPGWVAALAAQVLRTDVEVGAAGARLVYPGGRVQHAGLVIGLSGAAGHVLAGLPGDRPGYLGMAMLARDCSAVTGACLATRRSVFEHLDGFDEDLGLDLNDVDYCLRARAHGLHVVFEPAAELVHHESPSRGTSGSMDDQIRFFDRWHDAVVAGDPFLSRHLTRIDCSASLRVADEERWWTQWRSTLTRS